MSFKDKHNNNRGAFTVTGRSAPFTGKIGALPKTKFQANFHSALHTALQKSAYAEAEHHYV